MVFVGKFGSSHPLNHLAPRAGGINTSLGGEVAIEWPRACAYWREKKVVELIRKLGLEDVFVDGCALGLVAQHGADAGLPILKP